MALIKCPECGKDISDKSSICIGCGFPIKEHIERRNIERHTQMFCPYCGYSNTAADNYCQRCGSKISGHKHVVFSEPVKIDSIMPKENEQKKEEYDGIYRYRIFGGPKKVYCPKCQNSDCSYYQEKKWIPGKTKTKYSANLNPLKPLTIINKKEKVIRKEELITENKFKCNKCGWIFC